MKKLTRYNRKVRVCFIQSALFICLLWIFFIPNFQKVNIGENDRYTVELDGVNVGVTADEATAKECLRRARRQLAAGNNELVLANAELKVTGEHVLIGRVSPSEDITQNMLAVLQKNERSTLNRSYTVKIKDFSINLSSKEDVLSLLQASLEKYDTKHQYDVSLILDPEREVNALTTSVISAEEEKRQKAAETPFPEAGIESVISDVMAKVEPLTTEKNFSDFELGLQSLDFGDKVEIVESYLPGDELTDLDTAVDEVTKDKETNQIYEVKSGDTLSTIAQAYKLSIKDLVAMNPTLDSENSIIRIGDELTVTVPEPELTVLHTEQKYYEEDYEADVKYVDNDSWYTNKSEVLQEPSAGHRKVVALVSYSNDSQISADIQKEEITYQAVPKIVERGTIVPPTYIKPISGGRITSGFGRRKAPTRGASTFHKGVDWSTPVGTAVMASSSGTVIRAGWGSGYGYCVYISHADGRETRYGHLSRILVRAGQKVEQGDKIALSGNTGVSTGAHLHFEILVNGTQVNPLKYLN
jgi:murein DD-endopeptidase MepM/ murein hydrolase activator NlpD